MNRMMISVLLGSSAALGATAFANDTPDTSSMHQIHKQLMQQCVQQQKVQNSSASDKDIQKSCKEQVKAQMQQQESTQTRSPDTQPSYPSPGSAPYNQSSPSTMPPR